MNIAKQLEEDGDNMSDFFNVDALVDAARYYIAEQKVDKPKCISDCLTIGIDFSPNDEDILVVMRREGDRTYVLNQFRNDEAKELYNKLIGVK